ncbi:hypothetical protein [Streptomyces tirandamycinicus]|uniref:hypothetical protein n=1 Tax=Streptomyces tirandamycinicus TaxID=2174846 RepID=UPI0011B26393|nr:hypothetical protein [Streptomyces tirandamycinicus]
MTIARERFIAFAAIVLSVLAIATSVELGRTLVQALLSGLAMYGTVVVLAALALSVRLRKISKVSRGLVALAVIVALLLYGVGKALAEVIS